MNKKILYSIASMTLIFVLAVIASTVKPSFSDAQTTSSGLSGYAWSDGIGWINFNSPGITGAQVMVNSTTGALSGSAWSAGAGWLSFDRAVTGNPPFDDPGSGSGMIAQKNSSNNIIGWARFVSACYNNSNITGYTSNWNGSKCNYVGPGTSNGVSTSTTGEYWDGWVSFNRKNSGETVGTNYSVTVDPTNGALKGYAWGGGNVGWIVFNNPAGTTITDNPVVFSSGGSSLTVACSPSPASPNVTSNGGTAPVTWTANVNGGNSMYSYRWTIGGTTGSFSAPTSATTNSLSGDYAQGSYAGSITVNDSSIPQKSVTQSCGTLTVGAWINNGGNEVGGACIVPPNSRLCGSNVTNSSNKTYYGYNFGTSCGGNSTTGGSCYFECLDNTYTLRGVSPNPQSCVKKTVEVEQ